MNNYSFIILAIVSMGLGACTSSRPLFGDHRPSADEDLLIQQYFQAPAPVLGVGDKLTLSVWGHEELSVGSLNSTFSANASSGRWLTIDQDGEVNLPRLGRYHLAGHNEKEASYLLEQAYGQILQNPIVNVRVISHQVTILGEVRNPGQYQLNSELVNLVQLLGRAGGLDTYADARAVRIIRETTKGPVTLAADLSEMQSFSRYNVVLQPNDVVYVDANKLKATDESLRRAGPFVSILTGIGVLASLIAR